MSSDAEEESVPEVREIQSPQSSQSGESTDDNFEIEDKQEPTEPAEPERVISMQDHIIAQATKTVPVSYKDMLKLSFKDFKGERVTIIGWARSVRKLRRGKLLFLQLYDGTCHSDLQVIVEKREKDK